MQKFPSTNLSVNFIWFWKVQLEICNRRYNTNYASQLQHCPFEGLRLLMQEQENCCQISHASGFYKIGPFLQNQEQQFATATVFSNTIFKFTLCTQSIYWSTMKQVTKRTNEHAYLMIYAVFYNHVTSTDNLWGAKSELQLDIKV